MNTIKVPESDTNALFDITRKDIPMHQRDYGIKTNHFEIHFSQTGDEYGWTISDADNSFVSVELVAVGAIRSITMVPGNFESDCFKMYVQNGSKRLTPSHCSPEYVTFSDFLHTVIYIRSEAKIQIKAMRILFISPTGETAEEVIPLVAE